MTKVDPALFARHNGACYRAPTDLQITPDSGLRFLVVGGCMAEPFPQVAAMINKDFKSDFILLNNFDTFEDLPPAQVAVHSRGTPGEPISARAAHSETS